MVRRTILAAALCGLAAAIFPAASSAHAGNPDMESVVRAITPPAAGFSVDVLNGDDRLEAINRGSRTVTIYGYNEEPYVRMEPDGRVSVNVRSPAYYLNRERFSGVRVPPLADEDAPPQWQLVARTGRYEFHDHRMHWMAKNDPPSVEDKSRRQRIFDWKVPLRVEGTPGFISGSLYWRGSPGGPPAGAFVALALVGVLGAASVIVVRRRRRAGGAGAGAEAGGRAREEAW